jgi:hypothetical protein
MSNEKLKNKVIDDEKLEKVSGGLGFDEDDEDEFHYAEDIGIGGIGEGNWNSKPDKSGGKYSSIIKKTIKKK